MKYDPKTMKALAWRMVPWIDAFGFKDELNLRWEAQVELNGKLVWLTW